MRQDFYIYLHSRADDGIPFYIGKGRVRRCYSKHGRSEFWHNIVNKHGLTVEIIAGNLTEADAFMHEKRFIIFYGRKKHRGPLINLTDGGDGASGCNEGNQNWRFRVETDETRRKKSESHKGKKRPEHALKLKEIHKSGKFSYKIAGRSAGFKQTEETKEKLRVVNLGKKQSPEARAKMSEAQYRRWANYRTALQQ